MTATDQTLTDRVLALLREERARQDEKWGPQHHDDGAWLLILAEEIGETAQAALQGRRTDVVDELVQAGAVVVAWLEHVLSGKVVDE